MRQLYPTLLFLSLLRLFGCSTAPPTEKTETTTTITVPVSPAASVSRPAPESPEDLIRALYQTHKAGKSPFFQNKDRKLVDRFFVKEMAELIWDDATIAAKSNEESLLEADPLYNAQDTDIGDFVIHPAEIDNDGAEVLVTFTNFGEKQEFTFLLDKEKGQWRIGDLFYGDGSQLFQLLSGRAEEIP